MMKTVEDHYEEFLSARYTWMSGGHASQVEKNCKVLTEFGLAARTGAMALDLGCGSGYQSLALAELGFSVVAVDTSQQLLDELSSLATGKSISVVRGDMRNSESYETHAPFDANSSYQKLRLSVDEVVSMLAKAGYTNISKTVDQGFTIVAADKNAADPARTPW